MVKARLKNGVVVIIDVGVSRHVKRQLFVRQGSQPQ